ncbi:hypothetical protein CEP51_005247 [Fusarium floridanum]|uniref:Apple domain-containing protein n=1 Tax=Fusarium floridanum TaxID=1325733 RepID=A0A428RXQ1_9HYPO|nr:hypothetical protein CEP51_005247 [Fusarium floridanum]
MPSAKSFAVAALAASGIHAGACKPGSSSTALAATTTTEPISSSTTAEISTTITEAPTTTTASTTETSSCTAYTLKDDTGELNCGIVGRDAREGLSDGDSTSLEDCAKSCIEDQGSDESCKLFEYTPDENSGLDVCKRYADYFFTTDETGSSRYYEPSCFECVRGESNPRGGRGGIRGGGRRLRRR